MTSISAIALFLSANQGSVYVGHPFKQEDWLLALDSGYGPEGQLRGEDCLLTQGDAMPKSVPEQCVVSSQAKGPVRKLLLIGDSHAYSQFAMLAEVGKTSGWAGFALVHDGCAWHLPAEATAASCNNYIDQVPNLIRRTVSEGDFVLVSIYFDLNSPGLGPASERLAAAGDAANEVGAHLVIELPHIRSETPAIHCRREWFRSRYDGCARSLEAMQGQRAGVVSNLRTFAASQGHALLLWDPLPDLCDGGVCAAVNDLGPVLRDTNHISTLASRRLAKPLLDVLTMRATN